MELRIDNIDGFNEYFKTSLRTNESGIYEVELSDLDGITDERHFWECVRHSSFYRGCSVSRVEHNAGAPSDD